MRLSRILLPMVWPMVAVFAVGVAIGVAVPKDPSTPEVAPSPVSDDTTASVTPEPDGTGGAGAEGQDPAGDGESDASPPSPSASVSPSASPSVSPSASPSVSTRGRCKDPAKVLIANVTSGGSVFDAAGAFAAAGKTVPTLNLATGAGQAQAVVDLETAVDGVSDIIFLFSADAVAGVTRGQVEALLDVVSKPRTWAVATSDVEWSSLFSVADPTIEKFFVAASGADPELIEWRDEWLPCLMASL